MGSVRTISSTQLSTIAAEGDAMRFNRQLAPRVLKKLDKSRSITVTPVLIHEHISGQKVEPHLRTSITFHLRSGNEGFAFVDMKLETFQSLHCQATLHTQVRP